MTPLPAHGPPTAPSREIEASLPKEVQDRVYFFNSFFYKKLTEKAQAGGKGKAGGAAGVSSSVDDPAPAVPLDNHLPLKLRRAKADHDRVKKWTKVGRLGQAEGARAGAGKHPCVCMIWSQS